MPQNFKKNPQRVNHETEGCVMMAQISPKLPSPRKGIVFYVN